MEKKDRRLKLNIEGSGLKGISKSFLEYKQSLKNPTDEELKFHEFVHKAVKKREENKKVKLRERREKQAKEAA